MSRFDTYNALRHDRVTLPANVASKATLASLLPGGAFAKGTTRVQIQTQDTNPIMLGYLEDADKIALHISVTFFFMVPQFQIFTLTEETGDLNKWYVWGTGATHYATVLQEGLKHG